MRFSDIERVLGFSLPPSARKHSAWWGNHEKNPQAVWVRANYKVRELNIKDERLIFVKDKQPTPYTTKALSTSDSSNKGVSPKEFEHIVRFWFEQLHGQRFAEREVPGVHKRFDFVSMDGKHIGDAKYFTMVRGKNIPPGKFSVISEHVWLLENTDAEDVFLVFGNDRRVPVEWLRRYGNLVKRVKFYFYDTKTDKMELLN